MDAHCVGVLICSDSLSDRIGFGGEPVPPRVCSFVEGGVDCFCGVSYL